MAEINQTLAAYGSTGYVVAPAGFGKTHLIAASLLHATKRQLVLTHTYAGVNALRRKLRTLKVPAGASRIDTIASWSLRVSLAYPEASGWTTQRPEPEQWSDLYAACSRLLDCGFVRRILRASYGGLYVDEYQDCSRAQHDIVLKLARDLPCRILGDPLQGIFDFDGDAIDWERDIAGPFERIGQLDTPHRWQNAGATALGEWLKVIRQQLETRQPLDLAARQTPIKLVTTDGDSTNLIIAQGNACRTFRCDARHTVIAIHKGEPTYKGKCHRLAKQLSGMYSSIEEIEGKDLFGFLRKLQRAKNNKSRLKHVIAFGESAMSGLSSALPAATARGEYAAIQANTKNPNIASASNAYLTDASSGNTVALLLALRQTDGVHLARGDLFNRAVGVFKKHVVSPSLTLDEAAEKYQTQFRHSGRTVGRRRLIGTTLLVKGLEFDHAIVLDAASLSRKELYVALTRGARSLTVVSSQSTL